MKKVPKDFTLDHKWPAGLPTECEHCGNTYDKRFSLEIGPGRLGRLLKTIAPWLSLVMFLVVLGMHIRTSPLDKIIPIPLLVLFPSLLLYLVGGLFPVRTRLYCFKCDRASYFLPPDDWAPSEESLSSQTQKTPAEPGFEKW